MTIQAKANNQKDCTKVQAVADECDALLKQADAIIKMQSMIYAGTKKYTREMELELDATRLQVYNLENPPWYKRPSTYGAAGIILGIILGNKL